jgi:hypothetical protein
MIKLTDEGHQRNLRLDELTKQNKQLAEQLKKVLKQPAKGKKK